MPETIAPIQTVVHVGADGVLNLQLPLDVANADFEVTVKLRQVGPSSEKESNDDEAAARQEKWRRFVVESYGAIDDPTFFRHEQGELETREDFP